MTNLSTLFDVYSLKVRLRPALLTIFPGAVTVALMFPDVYRSYAAGIVSLAASCGVLALLAQTARFLGRKMETRLYAKWGGIPTTAWLRHRDNNLDSVTKARYHNYLQQHVPKLKIPTAMQEAKDAAAADENYRSASKWLLERTRDKEKFPLVFEENTNYGFQRNALALKPVALAVLVLCIGFVVVDVYVRSEVAASTAISLGVSVLALMMWLAVVSEAWVKDAAHAYARALLAGCDVT